MNQAERVAAITQIQANRAQYIRRVSNQKTVFKVREGQRSWYVVYNNKYHMLVDEIAENDATFNLNDKVEWTSNGLANGMKVGGKVVVVVPPNAILKDKLDVFIKAGWLVSNIAFDASSRPQVSYLVAVGKYLFWPPVRLLRKVTDAR